MATEIVGSKLPADNHVGQNGYADASSVLPGKSTPKVAGNVAPPAASLEGAGDFQTRTVDAKPIPPSYGMKDPNGQRAAIERTMARQGRSRKK